MKKFLFFFLFISTTVVAQKISWQLDGQKSSITYNAKHPLHRWSGTNSKLKGIAFQNRDSNAPHQMAILAAVKDFDSQNENRDAHALEVLEVLNFPNVKFYTDNINLRSDIAELTGELEFHGVKISKAITAEYTISKNSFQLKGNFQFNATDFGLRLPSFMLARINDEIQIVFDVHFISQVEE